MTNKIKCLDHGFVKLLNISSAIPRDRVVDLTDTLGLSYTYEYGARDIDPATCARISFDNFEAERTEEMDLRLVEYLIKNFHNTPVEMTEVWLEMKLPIFVARQFVRHRTATINEVSARYVQLPEEWYIPEVVGGKSTSGAKQGQEDNLPEDQQVWFRHRLETECKVNYHWYKEALDRGIAPEHARLFLHVNHYTHWLWKQDLHNLMHFLALRLDSHAQVEARVYAQSVYDLLSLHLPKTMELFDKYRRLS
jgi:thymidylate synthase, flavin-dependent